MRNRMSGGVRGRRQKPSPTRSLEHIHLVKDSIVNFHAWKGKMDLINIVMIGLAEELPKHEKNTSYIDYWEHCCLRI